MKHHVSLLNFIWPRNVCVWPPFMAVFSFYGYRSFSVCELLRAFSSIWYPLAHIIRNVRPLNFHQNSLLTSTLYFTHDSSPSLSLLLPAEFDRMKIFAITFLRSSNNALCTALTRLDTGCIVGIPLKVKQSNSTSNSLIAVTYI